MEYVVPLQDPGLSEIFPLFCGWEECQRGHSYGPAVREYFLIHHVLCGKGVFSCGKIYHLEQGQCFLICPGDVAFYQADESDPWSYCWIAFGGELAGTLLSRAGLGSGSPVFGNENISRLFRTLSGLIQSSGIPWESAGMSLLSMIFALFSYLPRLEPMQTQREKYIAKAKGFIASMLPVPFTVERLARYCGLDRRYLCRIFRQQTGLSPSQYILEMRMRKARELLRSSPLPVGDISRSVGYGDVYNFSRMFKRRTGLSPQHYRKQCRSAPAEGAGDAEPPSPGREKQ